MTPGVISGVVTEITPGVLETHRRGVAQNHLAIKR
jgi:hypothetical protein